MREREGNSAVVAVPALRDLDDRAQIHDLVVAFYRELVFDDLLGPVFDEVAEVDWAVHIPTLIDFWCRVLLGHPGYDGYVLGAHQAVNELQRFRPEHFDRWFELWVESIDAHWTGPVAETAKAHAAHMAGVLARRLINVDWTPPVNHPTPATWRPAVSDIATVPLDHTLGQLVAELPARARVFERHGLDYCCHGQRSLADAAEAAGIDADALAHELAAVSDTAGAPVDVVSPAALVEHILGTHHAYLHEELPLLRALADKVKGVHGSHHPELAEVARLVHALVDDFDPHLAKEEQTLFPAIVHRAASNGPFDPGPLNLPISEMMSEHETVGALLGELRTTTRDYRVPADGCASYHGLYARLADLEADTFTHIHLENNVLFPLVLGTA